MKLKEIDLYITEKCNLKCRFCSIKAGPASKRELDFDTVEKFVSYCKGCGVTDIHITGGEPTLHKNYKEIIELIIKNGIDTRLITNGLLLTESDLSQLKEIGLKNIMFSLDGLNDFHSFVRGKGTFERTLTTVKAAIEKDFNVRVNTVAWNENLSDIPKLLEELDQAGVKIYSVFLGSPVGRGKELNHLSVVSADKWDLFLSELKEYYLDRKLSVQVVVEQGFVKQSKKDHDYNDVRSCASILDNTDYLTIRADGNVFPCVFFSNDFQSIGNIYDLDQLDLKGNLSNSEFYQNVSKLPKDCTECSERTYCKGGCRGFNYLPLEITKDERCNGDEYIPICPIIKLDLLNEKIAPCTDDLSKFD